jgi:excisionase family DNA binding protein
MVQDLVLTTPLQLQEIVSRAVAEQLQSYFPKDGQPFAEFPEYVTIDEVAQMCNVSKSTVNNWIKDGRLKPSKNGRVIRFPKTDIIALLQQKPKHKRV